MTKTHQQNDSLHSVEVVSTSVRTFDSTVVGWEKVGIVNLIEL